MPRQRPALGAPPWPPHLAASPAAGAADASPRRQRRTGVGEAPPLAHLFLIPGFRGAQQLPETTVRVVDEGRSEAGEGNGGGQKDMYRGRVGER